MSDIFKDSGVTLPLFHYDPETEAYLYRSFGIVEPEGGAIYIGPPVGLKEDRDEQDNLG